jgi:hypothetical protein
MIKPRRTILLAILFLITISIIYIIIVCQLHPVGIGLFLVVFGIFFSAIATKKIIVNDNSLTFDNFIKTETFPFEVFENADMYIDRFGMARIKITRRRFFLGVHSKAKEGLFKIISLSKKMSIMKKNCLTNEIKQRLYAQGIL